MIDLLRDPTILMRKVIHAIESLPIICKDCHSPLTLRYSEKCITMLCKCKCRILYPPRKDRGYKYLWTEVKREDYDANHP